MTTGEEACSPVIACPGCGGRNEPDAKTCQWCDRPFVAQPRKIPRAVLGLAAVAIALAVLIVAIIFAAAALFTRFGDRPSTDAAPPVPAPTAILGPEPTIREASGSPEPTLPTSRFVQVANTGGTGAFIREEPQAAARGIAAYPDRTVLRVAGPDATAGGRLWKNVEDPQGIRGWAPAEFLVPTDGGF